MPLRNPPPSFPVRTYPVPVIADQVLIEWVTSELANSKPIEPGTPHPNTREYPGFKLGIQRVNPVDHNFTQLVWVTDATAEDTYNYAIKYSGDNISNPIFIRTYREKEPITPRARGSALQTVYKLAVVLAGTGYVPGTEPALTFAGGGGTGAAGHGVVAPDGTIAEFVITATGSGYTSAPTFTCAAPPSGTTATGLAYIQPTGAILVSEDVQNFPPESEFDAEYFNVVRVYETLPGPYLPFTRYDDNLGPIQGTRRAVVWANQVATLTATAKTTYESRDGSYYVAWELVETNSNGTGGAGNPAYPIFTEDIHDNDKGEVQRVTQVVVATGSEVSSSTVSGGIVTHIDYLKIDGDPFHLIKLIETWAVPRALTGKETNSVKQVETVTTTRKAPGSDAVPTALKDVDVNNNGDGTVTQIEKDIPNVFDGDQRGISIPDVTPEWARALAPTKDTSLITAATSISDPTLSTGQLKKDLARLTEKTIRTDISTRDPADLPATRTNKRISTEFGGGIIDEVEIIDTGDQAISSGGLRVVAGDVEILGNGTSAKRTSTVEDLAWPELEGTKIDDNSGLIIPYTKQVVAAGTDGDIVGNVYTEVDPLDKWRSISIASTIPTDLSSLDRDYPVVVNHAFPNTLVSAVLGWVWAEVIATDPGDRYDFDIDLALQTVVKQGYRGACDGHIYETYTHGPPSSLDAITKFFPEGGMKSLYAWYFTGVLGEPGSKQAHARNWNFEVPISLHDEIDITPGNPPSGDPTVNGDIIAATTPVALPAPGTEIVIDAQPEKWRFGIYVTKTVKVLVP